MWSRLARGGLSAASARAGSQKVPERSSVSTEFEFRRTLREGEPCLRRAECLHPRERTGMTLWGIRGTPAWGRSLPIHATRAEAHADGTTGVSPRHRSE